MLLENPRIAGWAVRALAMRGQSVYSASTTPPLCSSHADAFRAVDGNVSPSKPPQGGFAVSSPGIECSL